MKFDWKKNLLIAGFIVIIIAAGYLIYATFFKPALITPPAITEGPPAISPGLPPGEERIPGEIVTRPPTGITPATPSEITIPEVLPAGVSRIATGGPTVVSTLVSAPTQGVTIDMDGKNLLYYNNNDGKFYRITPEGKTSLLSDKTFFNASDITWSPEKEKTIIEYPDGSNIIYNFKTKGQITLPKHWTDFDFSPSGDQIASKSIGDDIDNRWLIITNEDGSEAKVIQELTDQADKVIVDWSPNRQIVAMYANASGQDRQKLYFVGPNQENYKLLVLPGYGFNGQWSPTGGQLLFNVYSNQSDFKPELWISNVGGEETGSDRRPLNVTTWSDKCIFADETTIYCAVPKSLERGSALTSELKEQTEDVIYKIDTTTEIKTKVAETYGSAYSVKDLAISQDQKYLFFTDYATNNLYKIQISD